MTQFNSHVHHLITQYGNSHQNYYNKLIHWVCVPIIVFSLLGLIAIIPNYGHLILGTLLLITSIYYFRLSVNLGLGMLFYVLLNVLALTNYSSSDFYYFIILFVFAWIGQFIGHKIEGKKPSFIEDIQFLLIGPLWLLSFIYKKFGIKI